MPLNGLEIVLAGGTGGLGSVSARMLAADGARVVASYWKNTERAGKLSGAAAVVQADLSLGADRARLLDAAPQLYGLVVFTGSPVRVSDPSWMENALAASHEVNFAGPILLAREAAERMRGSGTPGSIVLFSTMQAVALFPGSSAYAGAKAALIHAARILAKECRGKYNIRVNVIAPGVTQAGMAEASIASGKYDSYIRDSVIPRFGRAEDIARAVRFFLEPDNYITGQVLTIDGGLTL
jgi:3-oxoacyl-[acyl-carrier protein] reductase